MRGSRALHRLERAVEVREEVAGILEADLQADERASFPGTNAARAPQVGGDHEALVAAPAVADREAFEALDEARDLRAARRGELDAEEARGPEEVALPERMARIARQRGMKDALHRRMRLEGARHLERRGLVALEARGERSHAAHREEDVVRARRLAEVARGVAKPRPPSLVGDHRPDEDVGVAGGIF